MLAIWATAVVWMIFAAMMLLRYAIIIHDSVICVVAEQSILTWHLYSIGLVFWQKSAFFVSFDPFCSTNTSHWILMLLASVPVHQSAFPEKLRFVLRLMIFSPSTRNRAKEFSPSFSSKPTQDSWNRIGVSWREARRHEEILVRGREN